MREEQLDDITSGLPRWKAVIRIAARTDVMVEIFLARVMRVSMVHLNHPETVEGVAYLLSAGLLTPARAEEIQHG